MEVFYAAKAREDRAHWERKNKAIIARIDNLIADIQERPFAGLGKPEPSNSSGPGSGHGESTESIDWSTGSRAG